MVTPRALIRLVAPLLIGLVGLALTLSAERVMALPFEQPAAAPVITELTNVSEGQVLSGLVGIEAVVSGAAVILVTFQLEGPQSASYTEFHPPYFFFGDSRGLARGWDTTSFPNGDYTLTVTARNRSGQSDTRTVTFRIFNTGLIFRDTFDRSNSSNLGPAWEASGGWQVLNQALKSSLGGYGYVQTMSSFSQTNVVIEASFRYTPPAGPKPSDNFALSFGGSPAEQLDYQVVYYPFEQSLFLTRGERQPDGGIIAVPLAEAMVALPPYTWHALRIVRDGVNGRMEVFLNEGASFGETPVLQAVDTTYLALGRVGWVVEIESPSNLYIDNLYVAGLGVIFQDTFERPDSLDLGPAWEATAGWDVVSGTLRSSLGGYGYVQTTSSFSQTNVVIEASFRYTPPAGPKPSDNFALSFGGSPAEQLDYQVVYYPFEQSLFLTRGERQPDGGIVAVPLAEATARLAPDTWHTLRIVRDEFNGRIEVYLNGRLDATVLRATDRTYPTLGRVGWVVEIESPAEVFVDWIRVTDG
jgi:hypothetical protein